MKAPVVTLKNIKVLVSNSEETPCYTAVMVVDGKPLALVKNAGHGGCDDYDMLPKSTMTPQEFNAEVNKVEKACTEAAKAAGTFDADLEVQCHTAVWLHVDQRNFKSKLSRTVIFRDPKDGFVYCCKGKKTAERVAACVLKYGKENVLNCVSFDDAWKMAECMHP